MRSGQEIFNTVIELPDGSTTEQVFIRETDTGNIFSVEVSYVEQEAGPVISPYDNGEITLPE